MFIRWGIALSNIGDDCGKINISNVVKSRICMIDGSVSIHAKND